MSKKIFTQLSAAALLFCVASSGIQATELKSTDSEKKHLTAVVEEEKPAVQLPDSSILIKEIVVSSGVKRREVSPLRLVDIDEQTIAVKAAGKTYPELLQDIPGIYATAETGSYGDAKINIRGFKQENISVLLNGIPISGLTSGSMYWNNWMGLTDATATIQVQKGVGGSMLSDNSVGGSINIITKSPWQEPFVWGRLQLCRWRYIQGLCKLQQRRAQERLGSLIHGVKSLGNQLGRVHGCGFMVVPVVGEQKDKSKTLVAVYLNGFTGETQPEVCPSYLCRGAEIRKGL